MKNGSKRFSAAGLAIVATYARQITNNIAKLQTPIWIRLKQVKYFQLLAVLIGLPTVMMIWIDLDDRQAERTFRAWEVVLSVPESIREDPVMYISGRSIRRTTFEAGSSIRQAIEFLNREFSGFGCVWGVPWTSKVLTGSSNRECVIPRKRREILDGLIAVGADLSKIDLRGARLSRSFLNRANLSGANLRHAAVVDANLMEADLRSAILSDALLNGSNLIGADLSDAVVDSAIFRSADLANAKISRLVNVDLSDATLTFVDLSHSNIMSSKLTDAVLLGADVSGAFLGDVDFSGARLWLSDFSGIHMSETRNLTQAQLDSVCIDPRSTVRLPDNSDLTTVRAEQYFETCRGLTADPYKKYALFELLFKLSMYASGDPLGLLDSENWGYANTASTWLTLQSPGIIDTINRFAPVTLTRNFGMVGDHLYRKSADAQVAGESLSSVRAVELSTFTESEVVLLRSKLCQDTPWARSYLCTSE